jgi:hypothetical protein
MAALKEKPDGELPSVVGAEGTEGIEGETAEKGEGGTEVKAETDKTKPEDKAEKK